MFTTNILKNIIKKPQLYQSRFQSIYYSYEDQKVVNFKINDNIQVQVKPYCGSIADLCFMNEKCKPIEIPKHMVLKANNHGEEEIISPEFLDNDQEYYTILDDCSYDLFWKENLILKIREDKKHHFILEKNIDLNR